MTRGHRDAVLERAPRRLHQTFTLGEAAQLVSAAGALSVSDLASMRSQFSTSEAADIDDPIGQNADVFLEVGQTIADLLVPVMNMCRNAVA